MSTPATSLYDIAPGAVLAERYRIVGPHRQGGLSTAFEVTDEETGARCEFQLFPPGLFEGKGQERQFLAQLEPWKSVESDVVLAVRELLMLEPSTLGIVTDYPEGESLRQVLNRKQRMGIDETVALGVELLEGLEAIHEKGLVHGDVKPYTIHLHDHSGGIHDHAGNPQAQVLLVDGGLTPGLWTAKGLGDKTALIGTPYYAPVEQFGGDAPDVLSDVYNVGAVLYECATGVLPWTGKSFLEIFQAKLQTGLPPMAERATGVEFPALFEEIVGRGCRAKRGERWQGATEFREALSALA